MRLRKPSFFFILAVIIFGSAIGLAIIDRTAAPQRQSAKSVATVSSDAPLLVDATLDSFAGAPVAMRDFRGKVVIVDFWASWCPFCIRNMTALETIQKEFPQDVVVLGVHRTETESQSRGRAFADARGVTYPLLLDTSGAFYTQWAEGNSAMPFMLLLDRNGALSARLVGAKSLDEIRAAVNALMATPSG